MENNSKSNKLPTRKDPNYAKLMYKKHRIKRLNARKIYYEQNKNEILNKRRANKHKELAYERNRRANDPLFRASQNLRRRLRYALKAKNLTKNESLKQYLGCTIEELKIYLESKFDDKMTWDSYGKDGWEIDHIIPLSSASVIEDLEKLCHYTNLQPMWSTDNKKKGGKLPPPK